MGFSLFDLARSIEKRASGRRARRQLTDVQRDPHLSRDLGLPYRPLPKLRIDRW